MDPAVDVSNLFQSLVVYGPMGICLVYFMVKDWIRGQAQSEQNEKIADALTKVAIIVETCNRRA